MKATTYGTKEEDCDDNNNNIIRQPNNEGEKAKGRWVLCNLFFRFCFVVGPSFSLYVFVKPIKKFITKNLVITYKLSTIEGFYDKVSNFANLGFF